jgi:hypothetical protein
MLFFAVIFSLRFSPPLQITKYESIKALLKCGIRQLDVDHSRCKSITYRDHAHTFVYVGYGVLRAHVSLMCFHVRSIRAKAGVTSRTCDLKYRRNQDRDDSWAHYHYWYGRDSDAAPAACRRRTGGDSNLNLPPARRRRATSSNSPQSRCPGQRLEPGPVCSESPAQMTPSPCSVPSSIHNIFVIGHIQNIFACRVLAVQPPARRGPQP